MHDVQFELILTVALVVMVIFLFLRTFATTIIPGVAVPLSLVGTFGVMYLLGYSLNNLTLMALTISTGFVVDDAIVMIENIVPLHRGGRVAAGGGAQRGGADRLHDRVADRLADRRADSAAVHGRHRRPAVPRVRRHARVTILVSAVVSLTLTPMMCARLLRHSARGASRAGSTALRSGVRASIERLRPDAAVGAAASDATLLVAWRRWRRRSCSTSSCRKGSSRSRTPGVILGISEAPQTVSFAAMAERQQALAAVILQDPAVESLSSFIGVDGINMTLNSGRIQINLKPLESGASTPATSSAGCSGTLAKVAGITLYMQPVQDLTVEDRVSRTQYQFSLEDPDRGQLATWAPRLLAALSTRPELRDVASDQQNGGLRADAGDRSRHRRRGSASRRRRSTTRCTTPSASGRSRRSSRS